VRRPVTWLVLFVVLLTGSHLLWAWLDTRPPAWDRAVHLDAALRCGDRLADGAWREIRRLSGYYPPLVHCAGGLLHRLLGPSLLVSLLVTQVALAVVVLATYRIAEVVLASTMAGVAAGLLVGVYNQIFLESRHLMLDVPLTALGTLEVLALIRSDGFTRLGWSLTAGVLAGLGLLTKWTFPVFLLPIVVYILARPSEGSRPRWTCLGAATLVMVVVAAPWYLYHLGLPARLVQSAYAAGAAEGDPGLTSLAGWTYYLRDLPRQVGVVPTALLMVGLVMARRTPAFGLLLTWASGPLVLLTLLQNKDSRYTLPILPALALLSVAWIRRLRPRGQAAAVAALAVVGIVHAAWLGWGWGPRPALQGMDVPDHLSGFPSFPPRREHWPIAEVLARVRDDFGASGPSARVAIVPDHAAFSHFGFRYQAQLEGERVRILKAWTGPPMFIDYVVTKNGEQGYPHTTQAARALMARLAAPDQTLVPLLSPLADWPLPDGSWAVLYRVAPAPVTGVAPAALLDQIREATAGALAWVVREPRGFEVTVEPLSDADTLRGRVRRLTVRLASGLVGDFRRKPAAVRVQDAHVELEDARINAHALVQRGALEILDARQVVVRHIAVRGDDLTRALTGLLPRGAEALVQIEKGRVTVEGRLYRLGVALTVVPDFDPKTGTLAIWADRGRVGTLPVSGRLVNLGLALVNPVLRLREQPVMIAPPRLVLENGVLQAVSPSAR
jgi:hypothetical protein